MSLATATETVGQPPAYIVRAATALTTSYVATNHMPTNGRKWVNLVCVGDSLGFATISINLEGSLDGTLFDEIPVQDNTYVSTVTLANTLSASAARISVRAPVGAWVFVRASVKGAGGSTAGTLAVTGFTTND